MDNVPPAKRSWIMSRVRSEGNKSTELRLLRFFRHHHVVGWRRRYSLEGKPDFVFPALRIAVFVDGCFWHGCLRHRHIPASRSSFWKAKIRRNKARDRSVSAKLRRKGWTVRRIWEHDLVGRSVGKRLLGLLAFVKKASCVQSATVSSSGRPLSSRRPLAEADARPPDRN